MPEPEAPETPWEGGGGREVIMVVVMIMRVVVVMMMMVAMMVVVLMIMVEMIAVVAMKMMRMHTGTCLQVHWSSFSRCPLCLESSQYYVAFVASCGLQTTARLDCSTILCIGREE